MPRRRLPQTLTAIVLFLAIAQGAFADPIVVRSGSVVLPNLGPGTPPTVDIRGTEGFSFVGVIHPFSSIGARACSIVCSEEFELSLVMTSLDLFGVATHQGAAYQTGGVLGATVLVVFSGSVVLPGLHDGTVILTAPFLFRGQLSPPLRSELEGAPLVGGGTATVFLQPPRTPGVGPGWEVARLEYTFADPIPEPASLLLVGSGLGWLARDRGRKGRPRARPGVAMQIGQQETRRAGGPETACSRPGDHDS